VDQRNPRAEARLKQSPKKRKGKRREVRFSIWLGVRREGGGLGRPLFKSRRSILEEGKGGDRPFSSLCKEKKPIGVVAGEKWIKKLEEKKRRDNDAIYKKEKMGHREAGNL